MEKRDNNKLGVRSLFFFNFEMFSSKDTAPVCVTYKRLSNPRVNPVETNWAAAQE